MRLQRAARTNGGKSEDEATLSFGSVARNLNHVPQAQTQGDGYGQPARVVTKITSNPIVTSDSSYQI